MRCFLIHFVIGLLAVPAQTNATESACRLIGDDGGLPKVGEEIIYEKKIFHNQGDKYPVDVYSDTQPISSGNAFCFRYEIENVGKNQIHNLYWETAGIWMDVFAPGHGTRESRTNSYIRSYQNPNRVVDTIFSFSNEAIDPVTWKLPIRKATTSNSSYDLLDFNYVKTASIDKRIPILLSEYGLENTDVLAAKYSSDKFRVPPSETHVSGDKFVLSIKSDVGLDGSFAYFSTIIDINIKAEDGAQLSAPALATWDKVQKSTTASKTIDFIRTFPEQVKHRSELKSGENRLAFYVDADVSEKDEIYLVSYPIKISINNTNRCYLMQTYSPFPINFDINTCIGTIR